MSINTVEEITTDSLSEVSGGQATPMSTDAVTAVMRHYMAHPQTASTRTWDDVPGTGMAVLPTSYNASTKSWGYRVTQGTQKDTGTVNVLGRVDAKKYNVVGQ
jgi:hypothetical protein